MDDTQRYQKDKSTVIAIIKYVLYLAIAVALIYLSSKVIIIIVPFLIGFVFAKASRLLASPIMKLLDHRRERNTKPSSDDTGAVDTSDKTGGKADLDVPASRKSIFARIFLFLFPVKTRRKQSRRTKVSVVIYVLLLIITLALLVIAAAALVVQANRVLSSFPKWLNQSDYMSVILTWIQQFSVGKGGFLSADQIAGITDYVTNLRSGITDMLPGFVSGVLRGIISFAGNIPMILFYIIVIIMSGFYFLTDSRLVFDFLSRNIKSRTFRHKSILLVDRLSSTLFRVLGGYLLLLIITFFEALISFMIAGVPYAVILALITAVLDFMPVLGVSATMIPVMIYLGLQGNFTGVLILIIGMAVITVIRRFIEPPVLGNAMHMHPLATLFAMIFGVAVWGAIGFLMGPVVLLVVQEAIKGFALDKKMRVFAGNILNKFSE